MLYTFLSNQAMKIAYQAHQGQVDQNGIPYIFHPFHLAEQMTDEISVCVALLHDVIEDTSVTLKELEKKFPKEVTEPVRLLTHDKGEDYFTYILRLRENPIARKVKLADLAHNLDESRLVGCEKISREKRTLWREKYRKAREILLEYEQNPQRTAVKKE